MIILEIMGAVLVADFLSGLFHWLEDAYGREDWPLTGRLVTKPNILHHHNPRYFTRHGWFQSSWLLLCLGFLALTIAWLCGVLTWQVWLVVVLGSNANQVHKWAHRTPTENGPLIGSLQRLRLVQTPGHHALHHTDPKNSHYCVLTNFLNPVLDTMRFWDGLEWLFQMLFGMRRRIDTSLPTLRHGEPIKWPLGRFVSIRRLEYVFQATSSDASQRTASQNPPTRATSTQSFRPRPLPHQASSHRAVRAES